MLKKQSLVKRIQSLALLSTTIVGCWFAPAVTSSFSSSVLALPQEQINQKLGPIFVFTISSDEGVPLVGKDETTGKLTTPIFMARQEAEQFVQDLTKSNPEVLKDKSIQPIPLLTIYNESIKEDSQITFQFIGQLKQIEEAKKLNPQYSRGVPLFVISADDQLVTLVRPNENNENVEVIPLFFEKEKVDTVIADIKKGESDLPDNVEIKVFTILEAMFNEFKTGNDEVSVIQFVPTSDSDQVLLKVIEQQRQLQEQQK